MWTLSLSDLPLIILGAPLCAFVIIGLLNQKIAAKTAHRLALFAIMFSLLGSGYLLNHFYLEGNHHADQWIIPLYTWASGFGFEWNLGFLIDRLTVLMMTMVSLISAIVYFYSIGYMAQDSGYQRFFCYLSLFTFAMLSLVMSHNFIQLFFGWEMVGLASYLLIGFWFKKPAANAASLKAFLINRVGDCAFLVGILAIWFCFGHFEYAVVAEKIREAQVLNPVLIDCIAIALLIGAMAKSAQIPLHVWLPDSMEGPTPVSALIHAATMVTAGIFMITRLSFLFEQSLLAQQIMLLTGALTCFLMGAVAMVQNDIKRIIAYSTLSQLGIMMMAMGVSAYSAGLFHLTTHACFKALLFLSAGSVIVSLHHEQDIWKMGGLKGKLPLTYLCMLIGCLALIGFPFFSGFYSKELIIHHLQHSTSDLAQFAYKISMISVFMTTIYAFRLLFVVFHRKKSPNRYSSIKNIQEPTGFIGIPLVLLALLSIGSAGIAIALLGKEKTYFWEEGIGGFYQLPFFLNIGGIMICWLCYVQYPSIPLKIQKNFRLIDQLLLKKYGFDECYLFLFKALKVFARLCLWCDQRIIDGLVVKKTIALSQCLARLVSALQTGLLYHYAFIMILSFMIFMGFLLL